MYSLIVNILNKEIYGVDFDFNDLKCRYSLTLRQRTRLEAVHYFVHLIIQVLDLKVLAENTRYLKKEFSKIE